MDIKQFAAKHSVKVKLDDCNNEVIIGSRLSHIYDGFTDDRLGVFVACPTARRWNSTRKMLADAGFTVKQNGCTEGCAIFDATNAAQSRIALKLVGARTRREQRAPSVAQLAARQAFAARRRIVPASAQTVEMGV